LRRVIHSRKPRPSCVQLSASCADEAPLLFAVDPLASRFRIYTATPGSAVTGTPTASFVEAEWPIATDELVANSVKDLQAGGWSAFRLGKFYEALDALTGDVAYKHTDGHARELAIVTASHCHSRKLGHARPGVNVSLRSYITATGSSSMEVRTDAIQVDECGHERLVNMCHTTMVALDKATMRPKKGAVPPLVLDPEESVGQRERSALADMHKEFNRQQAATSMSLRSAKLSQPPTAEEMASVHNLHRKAARAAETGSRTDTVGGNTHHSAFVVFPEQRNVHGKLFGGFVACQAFDLAYFAAHFFVRGARFLPLGLDDAVFLQPVAVGDLVKLTTRVVFATDGLFQVSVIAEVLDPVHVDRLPQRSNHLRFSFAEHPESQRTILPETYQEVLLHAMGARNHANTGLSKTALRDMAPFFKSGVS